VAEKESEHDEIREKMLLDFDPRPNQPNDQIRSAVVDTFCQHGLEPTTAATATDRLLDRISRDPEPSENTD